MQTLYDFMFIDQEKVRSIYAQLFDGLHEAMEKVASEGLGKATTGQAGGDPFGHVGYERTTSTSESASNTYKPHDLILRDVLGRLTEHKMISNTPESAPVGSFVLLSGKLTLLDVGVLHSFIDLLPILATQASTSQHSHLPKNQRKEAARAEAQNMRTGITVLETFGKLMPHVVQFSIADERVTAWGAVQQKNMRSEVAHLLVQQGPTLSGQWYVLGLVDMVKGGGMNTGVGLPSIYEGVYTALSSVRDVFAIPEEDIIITPLLIFRKLTGN